MNALGPTPRQTALGHGDCQGLVGTGPYRDQFRINSCPQRRLISAVILEGSSYRVFGRKPGQRGAIPSNQHQITRFHVSVAGLRAVP